MCITISDFDARDDNHYVITVAVRFWLAGLFYDKDEAYGSADQWSNRAEK